MLKFLVAFLMFLAVSTSANAQAGCIDANRTLIYTNQHTSGYWRTNTFFSPSPDCSFIITGGPCTIGTGNGSSSGSLGNRSNTQPCPIDDYIWVMMILFGGLGYFVLRKNAQLLSFS